MCTCSLLKGGFYMYFGYGGSCGYDGYGGSCGGGGWGGGFALLIVLFILLIIIGASCWGGGFGGYGGDCC